MKSVRHRKIIDMVVNKTIETQEELAEELRKEGFEVTQATVSRDIKELGLIKVPAGDNRYRYAVPQDKALVSNQNRARRVFRDSVLRIDFSENIIVIKTEPGAAQAVALIIDKEGLKEVIGTVAGDDTLMVVVKPVTAVPEIMYKFQTFLG